MAISRQKKTKLVDGTCIVVTAAGACHPLFGGQTDYLANHCRNTATGLQRRAHVARNGQTGDA